MQKIKMVRRLLKDTASFRSATRRVLRQSVCFLLESKNKLQTSFTKGKKWLKKMTFKRR